MYNTFITLAIHQTDYRPLFQLKQHGHYMHTTRAKIKRRPGAIQVCVSWRQVMRRDYFPMPALNSLLGLNEGAEATKIDRFSLDDRVLDGLHEELIVRLGK